MMIKHYTYIISAILLASIAMPLTAGAYYYTVPQLYIPGVDSAEQSAVVSTTSGYQVKPVVLNYKIFGNWFGDDSSKVAHDADGHTVTLVSADDTNIYAIMNGKKHLLFTEDIRTLYAYQPSLVQAVSQTQLAKYPRVNLIKVKGDSKHVYYLTEGHMTRLMTTKVLDSYGVRAEDAVTISKQEFNFYPQNQYVYLESPLNRDVFQIVDGNSKRYLTPMAVQRLGITVDQITPINQYEMDSYKILAPVVQ